jgi:2-polyprenyl-6-methoxyphenol hydroxylase-like FAD-dependent oxidoreductase
MSCAIELAKRIHDVHLIDQDPQWRSYGAGITIQGPTFRALRQVGVAEEVAAMGYPCRGSRARLADGTLLGEVLTTALEPGLPDGGGILRPLLHAVLAKRTRASGVRIELATTISHIEDTSSEVTVEFNNGNTGVYDLVVGADGIHSQTRSLLFPDASAPRFTGQGAFRTLAPRPPDLDMVEIYLGDPIKAGVTPVSQDQLYMFTLSPERGDDYFSPERQILRLREVLKGFGGLIGEIRETLGSSSQIVYRPLQTLLVPKPWHKGHIVLIGDAVHAATPQLASGAGAAVEDGVLLPEYLSKYETLEEALIEFTNRRFPRCRDVVESSVLLGELELAGASGEEQGRVYAEALARLAAPA